ncbi:hypothetical protein FOA52_009240 [Chlamydomonas sp. UWO 241]|nr:hypothetical protein FOA52_009240 [Chlamydomonas sp. UWO 241]
MSEFGLGAELGSRAQPAPLSRDGFGLGAELGRGPPPPLGAPRTGFGLDAETNPTIRRTLPEVLPRGGGGGAGSFGLGAELGGPPPPRTGGFGLDSEVSRVPSPPTAFGLQAETRSSLPPPLPSLQQAESARPPAPQQQQQYQQQPQTQGTGYGLGAEIQTQQQQQQQHGGGAYQQQQQQPQQQQRQSYSGGGYPPPQQQQPYGGGGYPQQSQQQQQQGQGQQQGYGPGSDAGQQYDQAGQPSFGGALAAPGAPHLPTAPAFFTLAELPAGQRHVKLLPHQANDVMEQLDLQPFDGAPRPRVIDLRDAQETFKKCLTIDKLGYMAQLETSAPGGRLALNARESLLQTKMKQGCNRLEDLVKPTMEPGSQGFVDMAFTADGSLLPESSRVWQFSLRPVKAEGVGPTGLHGTRAPCLFVARMALFDRANHRFLGNVLGVRPKGTAKKDSVWMFDPQASRVIVRCNCVQPDPRSGTRMVNDEHISLYVEFSTSYRLTPEDTRGMPPSERKASKMVDEIATCWAMVNFRKCSSLTEETNVSVPLYYGSLYDPQNLDKLYKEHRIKNKWGSLFKPRERPVFTFKAGPVDMPGLPAPLLPFAYMPTTMLALDDLAGLLAAYRLTLALQLGRQASPFGALSDPVLAAFPHVLADHHLLVEMLLKWRDLTEKMSWATDANCLSPQLLPPVASLVEAFRRCTMDVAPLLKCASIPPRHINNFVEYQGHRLKLIQRFCHMVDPRTNALTATRHPVEPLSHAGYEYLHKPFNTSELRVSVADSMMRTGGFLRNN